MRRIERIERPKHQSYFSQHLYAAGEAIFQRFPDFSSLVHGNEDTEKKFRKYFGKKLRTLASSAKSRVIPISPYRCKTLRTLKLLTHASMKCPIISLKKLEILTNATSLNKISGYKSLTNLKLGAITGPFELKPDLARNLKTLIHLRSLSLKINHTLLVSKYIQDLKFLKHLSIEIIDMLHFEEDKAIMREFYLGLVKSKTLSYLKLDIRQISDNSDSDSLTTLLLTLSQAVIPFFEIDINYPKDYKVEPEILEAALSNVDLFTIKRPRYLVSLSTNKENPYQSIAQARRKFNLYVTDHLHPKLQYVPKAQLFNPNPETPKNDFDLANNLKLLFCGTLGPSFSLFNASNIQCVKAIRVDCQPLQEDETLEGFKNLQDIIQNSPSLERFQMNKANFGQREVVLILDDLSKLQQLETLEFDNTEFQSYSKNDYHKTVPSFLNLKKISLGTSDIEIDKLPFDFASSKNLTELDITYSCLNDNETIKKFSNLEKITIRGMPFFSKETSVARFIDMMSQLTRIKQAYFFPNKYRKKSVTQDTVNMVSYNLYEKAMELFKKNKSIEKFILLEDLLDIKCIRY